MTDRAANYSDKEKLYGYPIKLDPERDHPHGAPVTIEDLRLGVIPNYRRFGLSDSNIAERLKLTVVQLREIMGEPPLN